MTNEMVATDSNMNTTDLVLNAQVMQQMVNVSALMAQSRVTVPKHLQGSDADCLAVVMQAAQWRMNPFAVAQKTHLVNGNLGYEAQLINAVISSSRAIVGRFKYEYTDWSDKNGFVRCGAVLAGENDITWGEWLDTKTIATKNSPLWKTNPKQQAAYLAVKYWARLYCPDVILGVYTVDEFEDAPEIKDVTPKQSKPASTKTEGLLNKLKGQEQKPVKDPSRVLDEVISGIDSATTIEELQSVSHLTEYLPSELKDCARTAYAEKQAELKAGVGA